MGIELTVQLVSILLRLLPEPIIEEGGSVGTDLCPCNPVLSIVQLLLLWLRVSTSLIHRYAVALVAAQVCVRRQMRQPRCAGKAPVSREYG
jgi:hypothetical protein